jgi:HAD superfamily phosphatase (TIGR01668 family)
MPIGWLEKRFRPDGNAGSVFSIDYIGLFKAGYRLVLLDIDNTLVRHGQDHPSEAAVAAVRRILAAGLACIVVSNARSSRSKVFCERLRVTCVPGAGKPSPRGVLRACRMAGVDPGRTVLIGDQLFTDVAAAHRAGCAAIRVHPLHPAEPLFLRAKRLLERPLVRRFGLDRRYMSLPSPGSGCGMRKEP